MRLVTVMDHIQAASARTLQRIAIRLTARSTDFARPRAGARVVFCMLCCAELARRAERAVSRN